MITATHPPTKPLSDADKREEIAENIARFGVQLIAVYETSDDYRPYVHTIGLHEQGQAELIAFADTAEELDALADLFQMLAREGHPVDAGETLPCRTGTLIAVEPDQELDALLQGRCLEDALAYYGLERIDALVVACEDDLDTTDLH
jgi:hypothetical protein